MEINKTTHQQKNKPVNPFSIKRKVGGKKKREKNKEGGNGVEGKKKTKKGRERKVGNENEKGESKGKGKIR